MDELHEIHLADVQPSGDQPSNKAKAGNQEIIVKTEDKDGSPSDRWLLEMPSLK